MVNAAFRLTAAAALQHSWVTKPVETNVSAKWKLPNELVMSFDLFRIASPLKRIALNCLAMKSPPLKFEKIFAKLDKTQKGTISKEEFMEGFKRTGSSSDELEDLFQKLDVNMNGVITYTEFLAATLEADGELEETQLEEAFQMITKKSKFITRKSVMKLIGDDKKGSTTDQGKSTSPTNNEDMIAKRIVDEIFKHRERYSYEEFAQLFENGFNANRDMDAIIETSLNEEQLSALKEDDFRRHMSTIIDEDD